MNLSFLASLLYVGCAGGEPAGPQSPAPAGEPTGRPDAPPIDASEIARIDLNDPNSVARAGVWRLSENGLSENTCGIDPRKEKEGPCAMGCGETVITAIEPGVFTLETPSIGYSGTCVLVDGGGRFICNGGTDMATASTTLDGHFQEGGQVVGDWALVMPDDFARPGCRMAGAYRASMSGS